MMSERIKGNASFFKNERRPSFSIREYMMYDLKVLELIFIK
jgi:hypothetical protein